MKFTITGKKLEVSEELRAYAEKKVGKIERLFRSGDSEAFITFSPRTRSLHRRGHSQKQRYVLPGERDDRGYVAAP